LGKWAVENGMKISPGKNKVIRFTITQIKNPLGYSLGDKKFRKTAVVNSLEQSYEAI
jgi:hypothetical protein